MSAADEAKQKIVDAAKEYARVEIDLKTARRNQANANELVNRLTNELDAAGRLLSRHCGANVPERFIAISGNTLVVVTEKSVRVVETL